MRSDKLFTVIVPARNAASSIGSCLDSILALQPPPAEIIVVDDASEDDTAQIASSKRATVIRLEKNAGPGLARNAGAQVASSDLLAFTDADCEVPVDWLERFSAALGDGQYSGATGPYAGATDSRLLSHLIDECLRYSQKDLPPVLESSISSNLCVRREGFLAAGGFPAYRLPWSKMCYFGNEDEEFAHLLVQSTRKPLRWLRDNGVYHGYRPTLGKYFRQQSRYAEAILVSYARFPAMLSGTSNYSRGGGALKVLTALLFAASLLIAPLEIIAVLGCVPFLALNYGCVSYAARSGRDPRRRVMLALAGYPFLLLTALAWLKGLVSGSVKAAAGLVYWRSRGRRNCC